MTVDAVAYNVVLGLHILLIATWIGMDTGVFSSSYWIGNPKYALETRLQMGRLLGILDMGPRTSLILIFMLGLIMSVWRWGVFAGLGDAAGPVVAVLAVLLLIWLWCIWQQYLVRQAITRQKEVGWRRFFARQFTTIDLWMRILLAAVLIIAGVGSLIPGLQPIFSPFQWLDVKVALFGAIILCGVAIRFASADFEHAFGDVVRMSLTGQADSPERATAEQRIKVSLDRTRPWVITLWVIIIVMVFIATIKPSF